MQRLLTNNCKAEIIFPIAAFTLVNKGANQISETGVQATEGCSTAGGCAICSFMKMNDVEALSDLRKMKILDKEKKLYPMILKVYW